MTGGDRLLIVRHAMPAVDRAVSAEQWSLSADDRAAARMIRLVVLGPAYFVASPEPKAVQTLQEIAGSEDVRTDQGFAEVSRPHLWSDAATYRATARSYLTGPLPTGWEPQRQVARRFDRAVAVHAAAAATRASTLVIGTHGLAPTIWLASRLRLEPDPERFWMALSFPDLIAVDLLGGTVTRSMLRPLR